MLICAKCCPWVIGAAPRGLGLLGWGQNYTLSEQLGQVKQKADWTVYRTRNNNPLLVDQLQSCDNHCNYLLEILENIPAIFNPLNTSIVNFRHSTNCWRENHTMVIVTRYQEREKTYLLKCTPNEDSNQLAHPRSLIRVFVVRMKKLCILGYPKYA